MKSNKEEEIEMDEYEEIFDPHFKSKFNINESNEYIIKSKPSFDLDNTYATCEIDSQVAKVDISFLSTNNNEGKDKEENLINHKELTEESIEFLQKCSLEEKSIIANCIIGQNNLSNIKTFKELKNNLLYLERNLTTFMKIPYMRKNLHKLNINCLFDDENIKIGEEKIKIGEIENHKSTIKNKL